jgi:hypothetical protein
MDPDGPNFGSMQLDDDDGIEVCRWHPSATPAARSDDEAISPTPP